MDHTSSDAGIIPRSIHRVFTTLRSKYGDAAAGEQFTVRISYLEVYNEQLMDLLSKGEDDLLEELGSTTSTGAGKRTYDAAAARAKAHRSTLRIVDDGSNRGVVVQGLEDVLVKDEADVFKQVQDGLSKRKVAETKCNDFSSRSHAIFTMTIHTKDTAADGEEEVRVGKLHLVDLAGSESIGRSGARDSRAREAGNINRSLLVLGRVISALVEKRSYVPYRDSKLTRLLQDSLGGSTKTCLIATISPSSASLEETMSTLDYAARAKCIENRPEVNRKMTRHAVIRHQSSEIEALQRQIAAARAKDGVWMSPEDHAAMEDKVASLENQLEELLELKEAHETAMEEVQSQLIGVQDELSGTQLRLESTEASLAQAQDELATTTEKLEMSEAQRADQAACLAAASQAEASLMSQATGLQHSLTSAAKDLDTMHSHAKHAHEVATHNAAVAMQLESHARATASDAQGAGQAASDELTAQLETATVSAAAAAHAHTEATADVTERVQALAQCGVDAVQQLQAALQGACSAVSTNADAARSQLQQVAHRLSEAAQVQAQALAAAMDTLKSAQAEQAAAAAQWSQTTAAAMQAVTQHTAALREQQAAAMQGATTAVHAGFDESAHALTSQQVCLKAFQKAQTTRIADAESCLMAAVANAMAEFKSSAVDALQSGVQSMLQSSQASMAKISAAKDASNTALQQVDAQLTQWADRHDAQISEVAPAAEAAAQAMQAGLVDMTQAASAAVLAAGEAATSAVATAGDDLASETTRHAEHTRAITIAREAADDAAARACTQVLQQSAETCAAAAAADQAVQASAAAGTEQVQSAAAGAKAAATAAHELLANFVHAQGETVGTLHEVDASAVPAVQVWKVPARLTATSPTERVVSRWREHAEAAGELSSFQPLTQIREDLVSVLSHATTSPMSVKSMARSASMASPAPLIATTPAPARVPAVPSSAERSPACAPPVPKSGARGKPSHTPARSVSRSSAGSASSSASGFKRRRSADTDAENSSVTRGPPTGVRGARGKSTGLPMPSRRRVRAHSGSSTLSDVNRR